MIRRAFYIILCMILGLAAFSGCKKDKKLENATIPRLLVETRGVNYGDPSGQVVTLPISRSSVAVQRDPLVNEFEIVNAEVVKVDAGMALLIQTTDKGGRDLYRGSVSNMGSRIVLMINGNAVGARRIDGAIRDGIFYTFVELPDEALPELVANIKETLIQLQTMKK